MAFARVLYQKYLASKLKMTDLVHVEIDYISLYIEEFYTFLATLAGNAPNLNELSIAMSTYLSGTFANPLPSLHLLHLTSSLSLNVVNLNLYNEIPKVQPNLKHLDLAIYD